MVDDWNSLPSKVVEARDVEQFNADTDLQLMDGWPRSDKPVIAWRLLKPQEVLVG